MVNIKGEWEDLIYKNKEFIQELKNVQESYYEKLVNELKNDNIDNDLEEWLYDYIYNYEGIDTFEEYLRNWKK